MAKHLTFVMSTVIMLLSLAVFIARVWQDHGRIGWLIEFPTVAQILRHGILGITIVTVGASPAIEG